MLLFSGGDGVVVFEEFFGDFVEDFSCGAFTPLAGAGAVDLDHHDEFGIGGGGVAGEGGDGGTGVGEGAAALRICLTGASLAGDVVAGEADDLGIEMLD